MAILLGLLAVPGALVATATFAAAALWASLGLLGLLDLHSRPGEEENVLAVPEVVGLADLYRQRLLCRDVAVGQCACEEVAVDLHSEGP